MSTESIEELISSLTPEDREAVREFISFLKARTQSSFPNAVQEFIDLHPELLSLLA